jgi:hypothetical protein
MLAAISNQLRIVKRVKVDWTDSTKIVEDRLQDTANEKKINEKHDTSKCYTLCRYYIQRF